MQALYGVLIAFLRLVVHVFFRQIEVVGREHLPDEGPVIFVGNHPNSLMDPVLIAISCGRKLHFLAKDTLFKQPHLKFILKTMGAVPVKRRQDHADGKLDNAGPFDALFALLEKGGACGIFPEGISHAESELAPLKTGAARIALGAAAKREGAAAPVRVVPCGLNYYRRTRMRSRVLVQFGAPIVIDAERLDAWKADERETVRVLTSDVEVSLRGLTINAPDWETLRVLDGVRRLYTSKARLALHQHAELTRRFLSHYEEFKDEPEVQQLFTDTKRFVEDLDALGLGERQLSEKLSFFGHGAKIFWHVMLLFVFAPFTLPGLVIHAPAFAVAVVAGDGLTKRRDVVATTKVMVTTLLVMLAYVVIALGLLLGLEPPTNYIASASAAVLLPFSAWATIRVFKRQSVIRRYMWVMLNLLALRAEIERLKAQREDLTKRVWGMVDRLASSQIERILPPDAKPTA